MRTKRCEVVLCVGIITDELQCGRDQPHESRCVLHVNIEGQLGNVAHIFQPFGNLVRREFLRAEPKAPTWGQIQLLGLRHGLDESPPCLPRRRGSNTEYLGKDDRFDGISHRLRPSGPTTGHCSTDPEAFKAGAVIVQGQQPIDYRWQALCDDADDDGHRGNQSGEYRAHLAERLGLSSWQLA